MEILLLVTIVILIIILLNKTGKTPQNYQNEFQELNTKIDALKKQIASLQIVEKPIAKEEITASVTKEEISEIIPPKEVETESIEEIKEVIEEKPLETIPENLPIAEEEILEDEEISKVAFSADQLPVQVREEISVPKVPIEPVKIVPKKSWFETFKENNPDIEKFIGENLINKIGILILVLGISFFVKYAIDKDWINEPGRVGIGILAGTIVMGIAHRLRKKYAAFSSVFVAGAISIYYLTIGIAFHDYHLFSQTIAFIIMVVITIFSALVSVSYNRKELAILSLIGGFAVPFMVSTGEGNYKVLLTYIGILNIGMLIISYFKKWNIVTVLSFIFTCILYSSWFGIEFSSNTLPYKGAFFFATVYYLIFSIAPFINKIRNQGDFSRLEYFILIANTFFYFGMGASILESWKTDFKGIFTICLALYNLVFAIVFYRNFNINKNATYFLLGLTLTFITLTIPFQFSGNYITLFWAGEAVLLLWLSQKSKITIFKLGSIVVLGLMVISLIIDWSQYYLLIEQTTTKPFINKIFLTGIVALASIIFTNYLLKKEEKTISFYGIEINTNIYRSFTYLLAIFLGYLVGMLEISFQSKNIDNFYSSMSYPILYHFIFSTVLIFIFAKSSNKTKIMMSMLLGALNIFLYIILFHQIPISEMAENFSKNTNNKSALYIHYVLLACIAYFIYILVKFRKETNLSALFNHKIALWLLAFSIVFILSNEVLIHGLIFSGDIINQAELAKRFPAVKGEMHNWDYEKTSYVNLIISGVKTQIIKIGYPILWGVLSFVFLILGIRKQNKQLRIIALSLLGITILKLFVYDIKNVSETGKIIAFILLGVLILIISFVYQKIKKLVVDEPKNQNNEEDI